MLGDHAQYPGGSSGDEDRWVWPLDGLRVAERPDEADVAAVEVERFALSPQPLDHDARLREGIDRVCEVDVGQAVGVVLPASLGDARPRTGADAEVQPSVRDDVDGSGDLGQHGRRAEAVAGDEQT